MKKNESNEYPKALFNDNSGSPIVGSKAFQVVAVDEKHEAELLKDGCRETLEQKSKK